MRKLLTLCTLLCLCVFANVAKADVIEVPLDGTEVSYGTGTNCFSFTIPSTDGTLTIVSGDLDYLYIDEACTEGVVDGTYKSGYPASYIYSNLTPGTTYYGSFYALEAGTISATYEATGGDETQVELTLLYPTADDGVVNGKLEAASLVDGETSIKVGVNVYDENYVLNLVFGEGDNYLTMATLTSADFTSDGEGGYYTWTCGYDYSLTTGSEYPVVATLKSSQQNGTVLATATILTYVGTSESTVSNVTLVSSDPKAETDGETITVGEDGGTITLTFSDYVKVDEVLSFINTYQEWGNNTAIESATAASDTDEDGCATIWTITVDATTLEALESDGMMLAVYVTDHNGKLYEGNGYCTLTYYYTIGEGNDDNGESTLITLVSPESEITSASIAADEEVVVNSNVNGYMTLAIYDVASSDTIYTGYFQDVEQTSEGYQYTWSCPIDVTLYKGHSYAFAVTLSEAQGADVLGSEVLITYTGTTEEEENSTVVLESVTPDENVAWAEAVDKEVVVTFSGLVKVEEAFINGGQLYGSLSLDSKATGDDTTNGYSSEWTITVDEVYLELFNGSSIQIFVTAVDQEGNTVLDNDGNDIVISYQVGIDDGNYDGYTFDPENGSTVSSLSAINVGYTLEYDEDENIIGGGIGLSYNGGSIQIYDATNNLRATITADDCEENWGSDDWSDPAYYVCTSITISFDEITDPGVYTVIIPAGFFVLGSEQFAQSSGQVTLKYTVNPTTAINAISTAVSEGAEVYNLSGQRIGSAKNGAVNIIKFADGTVKKVLVK
ncbi:MAG: hypothetical protein LUC91_11450 [Prevotella sp.]|nr:hypothetical protein [Prevotella sp.]